MVDNDSQKIIDEIVMEFLKDNSKITLNYIAKIESDNKKLYIIIYIGLVGFILSTLFFMYLLYSAS